LILEIDDRSRTFDLQRPEWEAKQGKERRVDPDAQCYRKHNHDSETGMFPQHPQGIAQVLPHLFQEADATHIPVFFLYPLNAAEAAE